MTLVDPGHAGEGPESGLGLRGVLRKDLMSLLPPPLLLVVDDEDDVRELATLLLEGDGFHVRTAEHGRAAVEALEGGLLPAVMILDLNMPIMNGWEVWEWLQSSRFAAVPVVIWTASGVTTGSIGSAPIVTKGGDPAALLKAIRSVMAPA